MAKKPTMKAAAKAAPSPKKEDPKDIGKGYVRAFGPNVKLGKDIK